MSFLFIRGDQKFRQSCLPNIQTLLLLHSLAWSVPRAADAPLRQRVCRARGAPLQVHGVTEIAVSYSSQHSSHRVGKSLIRVVGWSCPKEGIHSLQLLVFTERNQCGEIIFIMLSGMICVKFLLFFFGGCHIWLYCE